MPLVEARPDYNSHKYSIEVEGDKIGVNGAVISELVAAKDPTPKPITYSNIYKSFVSDMSQVFGTNMNKKSTGAYYSSSEFGVHVYSKNKRRRIYLDTINRYSPTGEPSSINSQYTLTKIVVHVKTSETIGIILWGQYGPLLKGIHHV